MKATLETISTVRQAVKVEVDIHEVEKSWQKAIVKISKDIKLPGFRQGKVPANLVEQRLGKDAEKEIVTQIIQDTYPSAVTEVQGRPISDPHVEPGMLEKGKNFEYRAIFDVMPEVKIEKYTGFKLEQEETTASDTEVDHELSLLQKRLTQLEPAAAEALLDEGMMALVDFVGTADGKTFEGSKAENFVVDYGSGGLLKDFEAQVRGMKTGDQRSISFVYPHDYFNKDIAGKEGKFDVTVKEIRKKNVPALDDELAKSLGSFETLAQVRDDLKTRIGQVKSDVQRRRLHRQVIEQLAEKHPIEVPETMVTAELSSMLEQLNRDLQARNQTLEQVGITANSFVEANVEEAKLRTRGFLLAHAIAKQEELKVEAAEVEAQIQAIAAQSGQPADQIKAYFNDPKQSGRLET
ncbi:MAG: trigger factor, partial [Deltaproteobacteria bacterium]|nr:trigger factor [Deltaproteobacteria bacterium]